MKLLSKIQLIGASLLMVSLPTVSVAAQQGADSSVSASSGSSVKAQTVSTTSKTEVEVSDSTTSKSATSAENETATTADESAQSGAVSKKTDAQAKRTAAKLKVCQNHQKVVTNIMARISDRGQKQVDLFSTIADRTETFYANKGKTLSNYAALVADVNTKKATAQAEVAHIATSPTTFTCDGTNDRAKVTAFKDDLKTEISALKDFKTAVRNLIVGVKSVQGTTTTTNTTSTGGNQ